VQLSVKKANADNKPARRRLRKDCVVAVKEGAANEDVRSSMCARRFEVARGVTVKYWSNAGLRRSGNDVAGQGYTRLGYT
jgi:hypothetical protein